MKKRRTGFTLIELSIVIVIIALLIGGIMVGRDLVSAAQIRKTVTQLQNYDTAAITFKSKYGVLPGDMGPVKAAQFGFPYSNRAGTIGRGNENGLIQPVNIETSFPPNGIFFESKCFWSDLSAANLIDFNYTTGQATCDDSLGYIAGDTNKYRLSPRIALGLDAQWQIYSHANRNFFALAQYFSGGSQWRSTLPPFQAYAIDAKIDDGIPLTGSVQATDPTNQSNNLYNNPTPALPASGVCISDADGKPYNTQIAADQAACGLRFNASF